MTASGASDAEFADRLDAALERLWAGDSAAFQDLTPTDSLPQMLAQALPGIRTPALKPGSLLDGYRVVIQHGTY